MASCPPRRDSESSSDDVASITHRLGRNALRNTPSPVDAAMDTDAPLREWLLDLPAVPSDAPTSDSSDYRPGVIAVDADQSDPDDAASARLGDVLARVRARRLALQHPSKPARGAGYGLYMATRSVRAALRGEGAAPDPPEPLSPTTRFLGSLPVAGPDARAPSAGSLRAATPGGVSKPSTASNPSATPGNPRGATPNTQSLRARRHQQGSPPPVRLYYRSSADAGLMARNAVQAPPRMRMRGKKEMARRRREAETSDGPAPRAG